MVSNCQKSVVPTMGTALYSSPETTPLGGRTCGGGRNGCADFGNWIILSLFLTSIMWFSCRACFSDLQRGYFILWLVLDYISDCIYIADIIIRSRTGELRRQRPRRIFFDIVT